MNVSEVDDGGEMGGGNAAAGCGPYLSGGSE